MVTLKGQLSQDAILALTLDTINVEIRSLSRH